MSNVQDDNRFIEDVVRLLQPWGVPAMAAQLYGYLLLRAEPASLDDIVADLKISKSSASVAARLLEQYMIARRLRTPGGKRVLYEASDNYEVMLVAQNRLLDSMAELFARAGERAGLDVVRTRLSGMADFYGLTRRAMDAALEEWKASRPSAAISP